MINIRCVAILMTFVVFTHCSGDICETLNPINKSAYVGWPFRLDCSYLENAWKRITNITANENMTINSCLVDGNSTISQPELYEFNDKNETRIFNLTLVINDDLCLTSRLTVDVFPFPNTTCQEFLSKSKENGDIRHREAFNNDAYFTLYCCPPTSQVDVTSSAMTGDSFETVWLRYCNPDKTNTYRPNRIIYNTPNGSECPDNFVVGSVEFFDAGEYVCSVRYKEKTLYLSSRSVCVKRQVIDDRPSVVCPTDVRNAAGEAGVIICDVTVPVGPTLPGEILVEWRKGDTKVCSNFDINEESHNGKHSCSTTGKNTSLACVFSYDDREDPTKILSLQLDIRDLSGDDFGIYSVEVTYRNKIHEQTSVLSEDLAPFFARLAIILGLLFIVIAAIVIAVIYYKRNTLEVQLRWIKLRGYQQRGKKVYLSYYFDRTYMNEEEQERMNDIVNTVLQEIDCYDINRDGVPGSPVAEYVPGVITTCHSTIIVITSRFMECAERQFDSEQAFGQLLTKRKHIVFIVTPDGREALRNPKLEDVWPKISLAVKILDTFYWDDSVTNEAQRLRTFLRKRIPMPIQGVRYLADDPNDIIYENILNHEALN